MSITAWTSMAAVEANGVRVLILLLSTITSKMFFKESDISCTTERFFLSFLQIYLKRWTLLAKPFPLFTVGPAFDNDGPLTSIGSTFVEGWHWGSTNSLLSVESSIGSTNSSISPLVQNAFFPVVIVPSNMIFVDLTFGKPLFLKVDALDMPTCVELVVRTQYSCR